MLGKSKWVQLDFAIFRQPSNQHTIEANCVKLYTIDPEICSILIFQMRVWEQFLQPILCMIFQQKCSSCCALLTYQISLSGCLYFLKYWAMCVLQLFVNQVVTSQILILTSSFSSSRFLYMTKNLRQKLKYLENEKSFQDEIKGIFHQV